MATMAERNGEAEALDALLAELRNDPPLPGPALMARVLAEAQAVQAARPGAGPIRPGPAPLRPGLGARIAAALGGWSGIGGLVSASCAGLWLGFAGVGAEAAALVWPGLAGDAAAMGNLELLADPDSLFAGEN